MLIAGEDTTAFTLAWAIHQLCDSPRWASEIRREADEIFGASIVAGSHDVASRLVCAGAVASETMRLRPVVPISFHDANVDTSLGEYYRSQADDRRASFAPGGGRSGQFPRSACFPAGALARGFNPTAQRLCLLPFGSGPRMCPGRSLGLLQMKTLLSMLYKNFDVDRVGASADVSELYRGMTMSPAGLRVRLRTRRREAVV